MQLTTCVTVVALLLLFVETTTGATLCNPGTYWDHGTNKCDHCSSICHAAKQQGTEDACKKKCPDFEHKIEQVTPKTCEKYWYYDKHVAKCAPCGHICQEAEQQRTVDECNSKCPGYLAKAKTPIQTAQVPLNTLQIVLSSVVFGGVVLTIGIVVVKWRKKCRANHNVKKRPIQVDDDTNGEYSLVAM